MAVFGAPSAYTPTHQQQQPQQMQRNTSANSFGVGATAAAGGGAVASMPRSHSGPSAAPSSTAVPQLMPPARDTPSYNLSAYNSSGAAQQLQQPTVAPGAMVLHGGGGGGRGHQQVAHGSIVMNSGAGGTQGPGVSNGGFHQVRVVFIEQSCPYVVLFLRGRPCLSSYVSRRVMWVYCHHRDRLCRLFISGHKGLDLAHTPLLSRLPSSPTVAVHVFFAGTSSKHRGSSSRNQRNIICKGIRDTGCSSK